MRLLILSIITLFSLTSFAGEGDRQVIKFLKYLKNGNYNAASSYIDQQTRTYNEVRKNIASPIISRYRSIQRKKGTPRHFKINTTSAGAGSVLRKQITVVFRGNTTFQFQIKM